MTDITEKRCSKCYRVKPLSYYYRHSTCKAGYRAMCKNCQSLAQTAYMRNRYRTDAEYRQKCINRATEYIRNRKL